MNSFRFIGRGIEAAVRGQIELYESGGVVEQHTYDYEPNTDTLTPHRSKEEADDYRYFPEPDLLPVSPSRRWSTGCAASFPSCRPTRPGPDGGPRGRGRLGARHHRPRSPHSGDLGGGRRRQREAFNLAMNQPITAGANLAELAKVAKAAKGSHA